MLPLITWLVQGAVGPALVGLPVTWAASDLAASAKRWFRRLRRSDGLSRILQAAVGDLALSDREFAAVRRLLEHESTWVDVGRGTVEDLATLIASCLPAGEGALTAGRAIALGLLEFSVRDLEPEWFSQLLFARLDRMQAGQATALDQAMLGVHADLVALFAATEEAETDRFARVMNQVGQVLDRLPPSPADERQVTVYLVALIRWLNTDPWPQDTRFAGPTLTPAAIERKLKITGRIDATLTLDADDLARRCSRLVVLGGPGAGKTWLARRTARLCAEAALEALVSGTHLDEVELPLYTTCARLSATPSSEPIRRAIVSSAFGQLPDLGGARVSDALRVMFEERNAPTLLIADSLDEAGGADDRIRQADTLPPDWRIVLTSRPASWNHQIAIIDGSVDQRVGELQPLSYPVDVEQFITSWFSGRPEWAAALKGHLREHPALQESATVPLVLAFYCIVGGDQPLPDRRADLHDKVIRRMLTGRWRGGGDRDPDPDACLETLRNWAWSAADTHPVSGIGIWEDDFSAPRVKQSQDDQDALAHIAVPLSRPDPDRWMTRRRFVHRSLREHLVAEHVALKMSTEEAAHELLNHLWYDPDWEYAAPAALAMHPQRGQVVMQLLRPVSGDDRLPAKLATVDGCWEIRRFLARVALESGEGDWPINAAEMIGQARLDLATSSPHSIGQLATQDWPTSNRLIIQLQLSLLERAADSWEASRPAGAIVALGPTPEERARAREALLALLARQTDRRARLALIVAQLAVTAEERSAAREALLALFQSETYRGMAYELTVAVARLSVTAQERSDGREALLALLTRETRPETALELANAVAELGPVPEERARAREALLALLPNEIYRWTARKLADAVGRLAVAAEERSDGREALLALLTRETRPETALELANAVAELGPVPEERARAREALLILLAHESDRETAQELADTVTGLGPTSEERGRARDALLALLARQTDHTRARELADAVTRLVLTAEERSVALGALLALLTRETDRGMARELAEAVTRLAVTTEERSGAREALLTLLAREIRPWMARELADAVAALGPALAERARAREALLALLTRETDHGGAPGLAGAIARLAVSAEERSGAREALLTLLAREIRPWMGRELADAVAALGPALAERARAREALLALLARETRPGMARDLADAVAELGPTMAERARGLLSLLALLARETRPGRALELAEAVAALSPAPEERAQGLRLLLAELTRETDPGIARDLATAVAGLGPTPEERARVSEALIALLSRETDRETARELANGVTRLGAAKEERARAGEALIALLGSGTDRETVRRLENTVARLAMTAEERARGRNSLLALLGRETDPGTARGLQGTLTRLAVTTKEREQARNSLLALLGREGRPLGILGTAGGLGMPGTVARLAVTEYEREQSREALLALLTCETDPRTAREIADAITALNPAPEELERAREALLGLLARKIDPWTARELTDTVARLRPKLADLRNSDSWQVPPTRALLAAARQNSALSEWLAALPLLSRPGRTQ